MSQSRWTWNTVLVVRTADDQWIREADDRPGVLLERDLFNPPDGFVGEDETVPPGWSVGSVTPETPGVPAALALETRPRWGIRVLSATLVALSAADWVVGITAINDVLVETAVGWPLPNVIALGTIFDALIEAAILVFWPTIEIVWLGPLSNAYPDVSEILQHFVL